MTILPEYNYNNKNIINPVPGTSKSVKLHEKDFKSTLLQWFDEVKNDIDGETKEAFQRISLHVHR